MSKERDAAELPELEEAVKKTVFDTITGEVQTWVKGIVDYELQTREVRELRPYVADLVRDALRDALKERDKKKSPDDTQSTSSDENL